MTTRVITPFGAESTAAEVAAEVDLAGKRMIVTGGASGIGIETARALAGRGAEVTIAVRDTEAGARVAADIDGDVRVARLELTDLASVRAFVDAWDGPLDVLVNNAGVMAIQQLELTDSGLETQFATNHLGHFALAVGLHDALAAAEGEARIVSVSSRGHLFSPVVFEDINFDRREYTPFGAYGQSKTANVLFAVGATDRWADDGIYANALMPGGIATNLQRHVGADYIARRLEELEKTGQKMTLKTPEQGAATSVLVATSPLLDGIGGRYFEDCNEAEVVEPGSDESAAAGVAAYALDHDNADRLWELSLGPDRLTWRPLWRPHSNPREPAAGPARSDAAVAHRREPRPVSRDGVRRRADQAIVAEYLLDLSERHGLAKRERSAPSPASEGLGAGAARFRAVGGTDSPRRPRFVASAGRSRRSSLGWSRRRTDARRVPFGCL